MAESIQPTPGQPQDPRRDDDRVVRLIDSDPRAEARAEAKAYYGQRRAKAA